MNTKFEDLLCSFDLSKFFFRVCVNERSSVAQFFYDWQTLIGGGVALGAAAISGSLLWIQILNQQKKAADEKIEIENKRKQKVKAALIPVPHALTDIKKYILECYDCWKSENTDNLPQPPLEALKVIMEAAPYIDDASFDSFKALIIQSQVFVSRLEGKSKHRPVNVFDNMLTDLAVYDYLTTRLFEYGRLNEDAENIPYVKPTQADIENILMYTFKMRFEVPGSKVLFRANQALRLKYPGSNGWSKSTDEDF